MFKFVANLNFLFTHLPFLERFEAASKEGFKFVEFMFPYDYNVKELKEELERNHLKLVLFNLPAGKWDEGERGIALDPRRKFEFKDGVKKAVEIALALEVDRINCLVGKVPSRIPELEIHNTLIENLTYASEQLSKKDIKLMIEPLNSFDTPGFYINTTEKAMELIEEIDKDNIYIQYDIYHAAREGEDHKSILKNYLDKIGHIQIADSPDRNQPGTGDIDFHYIFKELKRLDYKGYISMEYIPTPDTHTSLNWLEKFGFSL